MEIVKKRKKRENFHLIFLGAFIIAIFLLLQIPNFTGLSIANTSFGFQNNPPIWTTVPDQTISSGTSRSIDLSTYVSDPENYSLVYGATAIPNMVVTFSGSTVTITPGSTATATNSVTFYAYDYVNNVSSNTVSITLSTAASGTSPSSGAGSSSSEGGHSSETQTQDQIELEPEVAIIPPQIKTYFFDDLSLQNILSGMNINDAFIFGYKEDSKRKNISSLYLTDIDGEELSVEFTFRDIYGNTKKYTLLKNKEQTVDVDNDGSPDYKITLLSLGENNTIDVKIVATSKLSPILESLPLVYEKRNLIFLALIPVSLISVGLFLLTRKFIKRILF